MHPATLKLIGMVTSLCIIVFTAIITLMYAGTSM